MKQIFISTLILVFIGCFCSISSSASYYQCFSVTETGKIYCGHVRNRSNCWMKKDTTTTIGGEKVIYKKDGESGKCPNGSKGGFMRQMSPKEFKEFKREKRIR